MTALAAQNDPRARTARLVHLTDLHFWRIVLNPLQLLNKRILGNANLALRRWRELRTYQAPVFLDYLAGINVPDVVITGDFTSTSTDAEFSQAREFVQELARRGMTPRVIPGNHDVYTFESTRRRRFERYLGEWAPQGNSRKLAVLGSGFPLIFVPTVCPNLLSSKGRILPDELHTVRTLLAAASGPLLVAGHYPILDHTYGYSTKPNRRLRNADSLGAALRDYRAPILYFCGHVHRFSLVRDSVSPTLTHLTSGALFRYDHATGYTGDFSEIHAGPDGFGVLRHTFHGAWNVSEAFATAAQS